ncbi:MAG TPA: redox-sensing transcriptional repressor Rex [Thermoanaerobaculia bacterium]|jgi:redox-sensing transcriptional repressor|nr:redox-sensing transcriptional repressor Rex [Thermoanaerobaculia bacterium]
MSRSSLLSKSQRDARESVSEATAARLSVYLRCLAELEAEGTTNISSQKLARRFRLNSAQIRKDLATFGEFGIRGVGYEIGSLKRHLISILGLDRTRKVAIIGAGRLGQALADYGGFRSGGFRITALFDNDRARVGSRTRSGVPVYDVRRLAEVVETERIEIGVITVPAASAPEVARRCWQAGLKAVLNFAPVRLDAPPDAFLKNVDLKINLETLSFYIARA